MTHTICYITPAVTLLGARISLVELVQNLDKEKFYPVVVCPKNGPLVDRLKEINVDARIIRFGNWRKVKYWPLIPGAIYNLTELSRELNTSIWHSNEFWSFPYAHLTAQRLNLPAICHFRCSRKPSQLPPRKLKKYFVHKADKIIALSQSQEQIVKRIPVLDTKLVRIPNGVDSTLFTKADPKIFRQELKIPDDAFLIGFVGSVTKHKGVEEFIEASSIISSEIDNAWFVIVGPDRPRGFALRMKQSAERQGLTSRMIFTGFRSDIAQIMASLDLLLTPSHVEAFGRVVLEAMAAGTPVIASRVGGIPDIISSEKMGILVEPHNGGDLARETIQLLRDPERAQTISRYALEHVRNTYSIQQHVDRIQNVYEEVLKNRSSI